MRLPTIHLNGTSADTLLDEYWAALDALQKAIEVLQDAAPNARDYYPQGDGAFHEAAREHKARLAALHGVLAEVRDLANHVQEQIDNQTRRQ